MKLALLAMRSLEGIATLTFLSEGDGYLQTLEEIVARARVVGGAIHDARIAALCRYHGVSELCSADRDFSRFSDLKVRNPLVTGAE
jgi:predicted nucleic acid-binding protein